MSEYHVLTVIAAFVFFYSLFASKLEKTSVNGALVYVFCGMLFGPHVLNVVDLKVDGESLSGLAEIALAICLFTDSSNANLSILRRVEAIPTRLLLIGLPLTILLGTAIAWLLFGKLDFFEVALIATMLAPTDAALGKAVVTNPAVPGKVRESLNVESGLNDGICVPVILFFIAMLAETPEASTPVHLVLKLTLEVIGIGAVAGAILALVGGFALRTCASRGWGLRNLVADPHHRPGSVLLWSGAMDGGEWLHSLFCGRSVVWRFYPRTQSTISGSGRRFFQCGRDDYLVCLWNSDPEPVER